MTTAELIGIAIGFATLILTLIGIGAGVWWKLAKGEAKLDNICEKVDEIRKESREEYHSLWQKISEQSLRHDQTNERVARLEGQFHNNHGAK